MLKKKTYLHKKYDYTLHYSLKVKLSKVLYPVSNKTLHQNLSIVCERQKSKIKHFKKSLSEQWLQASHPAHKTNKKIIKKFKRRSQSQTMPLKQKHESCIARDCLKGPAQWPSRQFTSASRSIDLTYVSVWIQYTVCSPIFEIKLFCPQASPPSCL